MRRLNVYAITADVLPSGDLRIVGAGQPVDLTVEGQ